MAESLGKLAKAFDEGTLREDKLTREDGLAAVQASAALYAGTVPAAAFTRTANGRTAIICIIFFAHLNRMAG